MGEWLKKTGKRKGKNNGAYGLKREDLVKMNKSEWHRELVADFNTNVRKPKGYFTEEVRERLSKKISKRNKEIGLFKGERNPWKSIEGSPIKRKYLNIRLRQSILERDNNVCQDCNKKFKRLEVHHIIPLRKGGTNDLDNLITLCRKCHMLRDYNIIKSDKYGN